MICPVSLVCAVVNNNWTLLSLFANFLNIMKDNLV
jgi:hypothetical protein